MRLCRFLHQGKPTVGLYDEQHVAALSAVVAPYRDATHEEIQLPEGDNLLDFLPPDGSAHAQAKKLANWVERAGETLSGDARLPADKVELLVPIPRPNKLFLLAGNYAAHIQEGGGMATERAETFPYVFMKPPSTTLTHPGGSVPLPEVSPNHIDYEIELAVIIGRGGKGIKEADALNHVAGYTVVNDISDRKFRPNPDRKERPKDSFFDWLHGKWHDNFCPCGPCIASADAVDNPQDLKLTLKVNGEVRQDASTAQQIFPVAAVIEFISSFVTLEPGDIISTGTPSGVGAATQTFLKPEDKLEASISSIGTLKTAIA